MKENQSDVYCKKVLRIKSIASYLLHDCIEEFHGLSKEEVKKSLDDDNSSNQIRLLKSEDLSKPDAKIFYDLLSKVSTKQDEMFVNLEPQGKLESGYPILHRGIYTVARMIVRQKNDPDGFQKSEFKDMKKCISIWIVLNAKQEFRGTHTAYQFQETRFQGNYQPAKDSLQMQRIVLLCLHDKIDVKDKSALMMLSVLFSAKLTREQRVFILKEEYGIVLTEEEQEDIDKMGDTAEGFYLNGYDNGETSGVLKAQKRIAVKMLKKGKELDEIIEITDLSQIQVQKLKEEMQLLSKVQ